MDGLPQYIVSWVEASNKIESLRLEIKDLAETHKNSTEELISKLKTANQNSVKVSGGYLQLETEKKASSLSMKKLQEVLDEYFEDEDNRAAECLHFIKNRCEQSDTRDVLRMYKT